MYSEAISPLWPLETAEPVRSAILIVVPELGEYGQVVIAVRLALGSTDWGKPFQPSIIVLHESSSGSAMDWTRQAMIADLAALISFDGCEHTDRLAAKLCCPLLRLQKGGPPAPLVGIESGAVRADGGYESANEVQMIVRDWATLYCADIISSRKSVRVVQRTRERSLQRWEQLTLDEQDKVASMVRLPRRAVQQALLEDARFARLASPALLGLRDQLEAADPPERTAPPARIELPLDQMTSGDLMAVLSAGQQQAFETARKRYMWSSDQSDLVLRAGIRKITNSQHALARGEEENLCTYLRPHHWLGVFREIR